MIAALIALMVLAAIEFSMRAGWIPSPTFERYALKGDRQHPEKKVLILGGSFIWHGGLISQRLAEAFSKQKIQMMNTAIPGKGPLDYLKQLERVKGTYTPDLVLLAYYVGNGLTNVQYHKNNEKISRTLLFIQQLHLYNSLRRAYYIFRHSLPSFRNIWLKKRPSELKGEAEVRVKFNSKRVREHPNFVLDNLLMETKENKQAWKSVEKLLEKTLALARTNGSKAIMVIFPHALQIDKHQLNFFKKKGFNISNKIVDSRIPQDLLLDFCNKNNISCLDLLPLLKSSENQLYLSYDQHLNEQGREFAAIEIKKFILEELLGNE